MVTENPMSVRMRRFESGGGQTQCKTIGSVS